jgi:hypothetical protein
MIREVIDAHAPFNNCSLKVYAKGSYANNTNVRSDSDVDIAVECTDVLHWEEAESGIHKPGKLYEGIWTPAKLRTELVTALKKEFANLVDDTGTTAIQVNSSSSRVDADVVPCFSYEYYMKYETWPGTKIFKTDGNSIVNYPAQQSLPNTRTPAQPLGSTPTIPLASSYSRAKSIPASWIGSRNCGATAFSRAAAGCGVPVAIDTAEDEGGAWVSQGGSDAAGAVH